MTAEARTPTPVAPVAPAQPLLEVQGLAAWYGAAQVLFDVALNVQAGEVVALVGRNGAGKSTTLKALMGLVPRRRGQLRFLGRDLLPLAPHAIARLGLGYVPEDRRIFTDLTVRENLEVGRKPAPAGLSGQRGAEGPAVPRLQAWTPARLFELFPNLAEMQERPAGHMSGGEQQMLTVARTLMGNPLLVLLDEPSEGVAPLIAEGMAQMILALKRSGAAVLLSEQNLHFAGLVSDRAYVLERGQIRYEGPFAELMADAAARRAWLAI
jgi:branched-chain amino acid transport system ATP-binding protein